MLARTSSATVGILRVAKDGGAVGNDWELDSPKKVDPLTRSERLIGLRNSLDFVKNILKSPQAMECALTL